jgi:hypothetical protein
MYSDAQPLTLPVSAILHTMNEFKRSFLPQSLSSVLPPPPAKPLHIETISTAVLEDISQSLGLNQKSSPAVDGNAGHTDRANSIVYEVEDILRLAS